MLVNKPLFRGTIKNSLHICKAFKGSHNLSLKLVSFGSQEKHRPFFLAIPASSCWPLFPLFSPSGEPGASEVAEVPPVATSCLLVHWSWQQLQWTPAANLHGLAQFAVSPLGFRMSKKATKGLFKRAFWLFCPFRKSIQAKHHLDQKNNNSKNIYIYIPCLLFWG